MLFLIVAIGVANIGLGLYFIWVCKEVIDMATAHVPASMWRYVTMMLAVLLLRLTLMGIRQYVANHAYASMMNGIRRRVFSCVMKAPWHGREAMAVGDAMSRLGEDIRVVVSCLTGDVPSSILAFVQLLAASWFLYMLQPVLMYVLLAITPLALILSKIYYKTTRRLTKQIREEEADITSHMQESLLNRALLLSLQRVGMMIDRLGGKQEVLLNTYHRRIRFSVHTRLFVQGCFMFGYAAAFIWGAYGIMMCTVTYGMMTAFLQLVAQVQHPIQSMSELLPRLVQATTAADRLRELSKDDAVDVETSADDTAAPAEPRDITMNDVTFRYPDGERDILRSLSLCLKAGSTTAIIGPTGAGKSTLIRLLLGLLRPTSGTIDTAHQRIAYVPQGNSLLRGTIRDNLLLGNPDASDEEQREALRRASALFVYDLPEGLDTACGEKGSGLSEGQAQRIAIARALLQKGTVMILDEASSALDPDTERQILEDLQHTQMGKTLIWVTHHAVVSEYMQHSVMIN